jgi:hypothetical protein
MTLIGDCYRVIHGTFSRKPSQFGWSVEGKLAASGKIMIISQLTWAKQHGIKSVIIIRERPLNEKWFPQGCGIDYRHLSQRRLAELTEAGIYNISINRFKVKQGGQY